jgi:hypothetical protein
LEAGNHRTKPVIKLTSVFTKETDVKNKEILKLYDDLSYEFLFFEFYKNKPRVKREKGTYSLKKQKLILKNSSKIKPKEHSEKFLLQENEGLFSCNRFGKINKSSQSSYLDNKDKKYWEETYMDSVFGEITNDKKATKKIIEKKPKYNPVATLPSYTIDVQKKEDDYTINEALLNNTFISKDSLKQIKAIIIVGPVSKEEDKKTIEDQKKNAKYLRNMGVQVFEFYPPYDKWEAIVKASEGAHILIYDGHGSNQGINYEVGGLCLTKHIYHAQDIVNEFKLHKNAVILFHGVCNAAGSSADDNSDIGKEEALKRVGEYAFPFIKLNAGVYYANNYNSSWVDFFDCFFAKKTMKKIYTKEATKYQKIEVCRKYQYDQKFEIAVASRAGTGETRIRYSSTNNGAWKEEKYKDFKTYDIAYVGNPNLTVVDLFK